MTKRVVWVDSSIQMEMYILDNGKMIKLMGKVFICIKMVQSIQEIGFKILNMVLVGKSGSMAHLTKGTFIINQTA